MNISVVIPCYNSEETLRVAVDSAAKAFEVLVVDDASPGGCADLVRSWNWPNVRVLVHPKNLGLGAARNTGSRAASGEWIAYLDADDAFEPQWQERLTTFLVQAPEATWAYHPVREWDGQHLGAIRFGDQPRQISDLVLKRPAIAPSACLLRADIAREHPFDTNQRLQGTEDLELWMRLWAVGHRPIRWTDEPFTRYRINHGMSAELESHSIKIRLRWAQFVQQGWIPQAILKHAEGELMRQKARSHHKAGRFAEAKKAYWAAGFTVKNGILAALATLKIRI